MDTWVVVVMAGSNVLSVGALLILRGRHLRLKKLALHLAKLARKVANGMTHVTRNQGTLLDVQSGLKAEVARIADYSVETNSRCERAVEEMSARLDQVERIIG